MAGLPGRPLCSSVCVCVVGQEAESLGEWQMVRCVWPEQRNGVCWQEGMSRVLFTFFYQFTCKLLSWRRLGQQMQGPLAWRGAEAPFGARQHCQKRSDGCVA